MRFNTFHTQTISFYICHWNLFCLLSEILQQPIELKADVVDVSVEKYGWINNDYVWVNGLRFIPKELVEYHARYRLSL